MSGSTTEPDRVHLVTGGGGYPGFNLGKKLAQNGKKVILVDIIKPRWPLEENMSFIQCNIAQGHEVEEALKGADCVYHMASYGMSGREQLNTKVIEAVNVEGTENVIKACLKHKIRRLVYTSTYNVIFGGQEIRDGNESLPYLPLDKHPDHYSRTKSIAEQKVLATNDPGVLHTCALRLAGVYGVGELRHIPRTVNTVQMGAMKALFGKDSLQDFLHVDNLVQAHILAGQALMESKKCVAAGQAYFLSDGAPINTFEFFRPLLDGLGYPLPKIYVPVSLVYAVAFIIEWIHFFVGRVYNFQPILTRTEVYKSGVTHYFSIKKASRDLGYKPTIQNEISDVLEEYIQKGFKKRKRKQSALMYYFVNLIIAVIFASFVLSWLPGVK
ncbi:short-chain dehydrogenase/reductase family 42E member 1-like [Saccostrea echinata]|uniref:short-chain dehydrogenase/reductase family 42E member 1-like n=1 Tax=Saccostrea echinata TaxID=191078 RepID=UPI002A83B777|nr:short-chain dehydrogenase/reductase family 42E member 1-like [Saccostrea echinata]